MALMAMLRHAYPQSPRVRQVLTTVARVRQSAHHDGWWKLEEPVGWGYWLATPGSASGCWVVG